MAAINRADARLTRSVELYHRSRSGLVACMLVTDTYIISGMDNMVIHVLDRRNDRHRIFEGHTGGVWTLAVVNNMLISGSTDMSVKLWNIQSGYGHNFTVI